MAEEAPVTEYSTPILYCATAHGLQWGTASNDHYGSPCMQIKEDTPCVMVVYERMAKSHILIRKKKETRKTNTHVYYFNVFRSP
jgi:hypothetical protein